MDPPDDRSRSGARKIYQFLTLAYPREHRQAYGPWMVQLFCDQYRRARTAAQPGGLASFWTRTLADLAASALREQVDQFRRVMMGKTGSNSAEPGDRLGRIINRGLVGLAILILFIGGSYFLALILGPQEGLAAGVILAALTFVIFWVVKPHFGPAARRRIDLAWIAAGVLILPALVVLVNPQKVIAFPLSSELDYVLTLAYFFIPAAALVIAALLFHTGWRFVQERRKAAPGEGGPPPAAGRALSKAAAAVFGLAALVLGLTLYNLYWLAIWDSTTDSLDFIWLVGPVLAAVFAGLLLAALLPWRVKWAGVSYAVLIPLLMIGVFNRAKQIDFRQLTEARAGQVTQAIEAYYAREGRYPLDLRQLTPLYLVAIPDPVIMQGQSWCYLAGEDYYRLGYLNRDHWSSPILYGRVVAAKGHSGLKMDVCQAAIEAYQTQVPDWFQTLEIYGQPTPTPDIRE
jgi:hypothetical protein